MWERQKWKYRERKNECERVCAWDGASVCVCEKAILWRERDNVERERIRGIESLCERERKRECVWERKKYDGKR